MCTSEILASTSLTDLRTDIDRVCAKVAPVWPLESFVAVNPYFGMREQSFERVAETLGRVAGARTTMPLSYYANALDEGKIARRDVEAVLGRSALDEDLDTFVASLRAGDAHRTPSVPTVADVATEVTGVDWSQFTVERVSAFASAFFDDGQALWPAPHADEPLFAAWRTEAEIDRTPEIMGLRGFRKTLKGLPEEPLKAAEVALERLQIPAAGRGLYLHRLLMRVGGWASYAARVVWDENLYRSEKDDTLAEFLCVLLCFELALHDTLEATVTGPWTAAHDELVRLSQSAAIHDSLTRELVMQNAFERSEQRRLAGRFASRQNAERNRQRPAVQAVFCIDVRSEVFRRHFEATSSEVETLGFAGFFAFPIAYRQLGHERSANQCPVLLTPAHEVAEVAGDETATQEAALGRKLTREVKRAWQSFKMGAISCFSFVGPVGLAYLPKLFTDGFGMTRPVPHPETDSLDHAAAARKEPRLTMGDDGLGIPLEARIELAAGALGAMSLTRDFARIVLIAGHGSTTVNNPHATGLDCGACGGRTGEANARVAAATLNDPEVRDALADKGIAIPEDTVFVAAQHDTTTDEVAIFGDVPASHREDLAQLEQWLVETGRRTRAERALRLNLTPNSGDVDTAVLRRSRDWAQTRPEWGLAGCSAFVVAPRQRTEGIDFGGRSFLHSYEWQQDGGFGVLELIMTAPMVVASWISLQYYASTVDNRVFGAGNKTLHNVVGAVGVLEGFAGDLRVGLPVQSVHDGENHQHDPVRLNVVIEAPVEAMNDIIAKHELVRQLLDNDWLHLFQMDAEGLLAQRYAGNLKWEPLSAGITEEEAAESAEESDFAGSSAPRRSA